MQHTQNTYFMENRKKKKNHNLLKEEERKKSCWEACVSVCEMRSSWKLWLDRFCSSSWTKPVERNHSVQFRHHDIIQYIQTKENNDEGNYYYYSCCSWVWLYHKYFSASLKMLRHLSDFNKVTCNETVISLYDENIQHLHHICTMSARNSKRFMRFRIKTSGKTQNPNGWQKRRIKQLINILKH